MDILSILSPLNFLTLLEALDCLIWLEMRCALSTRSWRKSIANLPSDDPPLVMLIVAQCALKS
jgi:hypothetical protein